MKELETLCNNKFKDAYNFCQAVFPDGEVSIRCIAESAELKKKLENMGSGGKKLEIIKLQPMHGPLEKRLESAAGFNERGYGVFYLPARFKAGVYAENYDSIIAHRAIVVDLDGADIGPIKAFGVPCTVIIETSPGRYQCVWKFEPSVKVEELSVDSFNEFSAALGALFGGDLSVAKATQCFRLPGFLHQKGEKYASRVTHDSQYRPCSFSELALHVHKSVRSSTHVFQGHNGTNTGNGNSNGGPAPDVRDSTGPGIDLEEVRKGKLRVKPGERHDTLIRLVVSLFHSGLNRSEVEAQCEKIVSEQFEDGAAFLVKRKSEFDECVRDGEKYFELNQEKERAAAIAQLQKSEKLRSDFKYDYSCGVMTVNRYSQSAVAERVLQRFCKDFARIDDRIYCFNGQEKLWCLQDTLYPETKARVFSCLKDMVSESGFLQTCCKDSRGKFSPDKQHSVQLELFKVNSVHAISKSVLNHVALPKYKFEDFDAQASLLFCQNGVLCMETKELREAKNEDRLICRSPVIWNERATCPGWLQFLNEVFAENENPEEMVRFMQELFAYTLSGRINEQKIFCFEGDGANGKSKTLDALKLITGSYHTILEPEELVNKVNSFRSKAFERTGAKVEGKRVVIIDDFEVESAWNESFVKTLTSPDIRCRGEYERSRVSPNRAKFYIGLNKAPKPEAENMGILRRLCFVPFQRTFPVSAVKSDEIDKMIRSEAAGILKWAVDAFEDVRCKGVTYPHETTAALDAYRKENFSLQTLVEELYEPVAKEEEQYAVPLTELVDEINTVCRERNLMHVLVSSQTVSSALRRANCWQARKYNNGVRGKTSYFYLRRVKGEKNVLASSKDLLVI